MSNLVTIGNRAVSFNGGILKITSGWVKKGSGTFNGGIFYNDRIYMYDSNNIYKYSSNNVSNIYNTNDYIMNSLTLGPDGLYFYTHDGGSSSDPFIRILYSDDSSTIIDERIQSNAVTTSKYGSIYRDNGDIYLLLASNYAYDFLYRRISGTWSTVYLNSSNYSIIESNSQFDRKHINEFFEYNGTVYHGGLTVDGVSGLAEFDGTSNSATIVSGITNYQDSVYYDGYQYLAMYNNGVRRFDGVNLNLISGSDSLGGDIERICEIGGDIYVSVKVSVGVHEIHKWDGLNWSKHSDLNGVVKLGSIGGKLHAVCDDGVYQYNS